MRIFAVLSALLFLSLSCNSLAAEITIEKVSADVHILSGKEYGTNIGVVRTDNGLVLIDPMPGEGHLPELKRAIGSLYESSAIYILNTHNHEDHAGGNEFFIETGGQLVEEGQAIEGLTRLSVNSHTARDQIYFHKESNSIFVGDVFDNNWHPTFYSGGIGGFDSAIDQILELGDPDSLIIPGHGKLANKSSVRDFRENTHEWIEQVRVHHANGMPLDDMVDNDAILRILDKFNTEQRSPFLPPNALRRFIERTISLVEDNTQSSNNG